LKNDEGISPATQKTEIEEKLLIVYYATKAQSM